VSRASGMCPGHAGKYKKIAQTLLCTQGMCTLPEKHHHNAREQRLCPRPGRGGRLIINHRERSTSSLESLRTQDNREVVKAQPCCCLVSKSLHTPRKLPCSSSESSCDVVKVGALLPTQLEGKQRWRAQRVNGGPGSVPEGGGEAFLLQAMGGIEKRNQ
jgi:hypothetical protein